MLKSLLFYLILVLRLLFGQGKMSKQTSVSWLTHPYKMFGESSKLKEVPEIVNIERRFILVNKPEPEQSETETDVKQNLLNKLKSNISMFGESLKQNEVLEIVKSEPEQSKQPETPTDVKQDLLNKLKTNNQLYEFTKQMDSLLTMEDTVARFVFYLFEFI